MADLVVPTDLATYLQRDLDTASALLACASASALVRAYCRTDILSTEYADVLLPVEALDWSWAVRFPQRPVTEVASVSVNGTAYVSGVDYVWNGWAPYVRLAWLATGTATFEDEPSALVTYTAGYAATPPLVKAVTLAVAARQYDNPQGIRTRTIDDYTETRAGIDDDLAGVTLLAAERRILNLFRITVGSVPVR